MKIDLMAAELIDRAADRIERDGWAQDPGRDGDSCCAFLAIVDECDDRHLGSGETEGVVAFLRQEIKEELGFFSTAYVSVVGWNDEPGRTKEEVLAAMRKAAGRARGDVG